MVHTFFARAIARRASVRAAQFARSRTGRRIIRRAARSRVGRSITQQFSRARPVSRTIAGVAGRALRSTGRFLFTTKTGIATQLALGAAVTSPAIRRGVKRIFKEEPLLFTPLAPIAVGKQIGKAVKRFRDAPKGKKLAAIAGGVGLVGIAGAAIVGGAALGKKLTGKGVLGQTPPALAGAAIVGKIPTAPQAAAKQPGDVPVAVGKAVPPVNVTTKIIVQNF